jgi:alpha-L-rhamnosidase
MKYGRFITYPGLTGAEYSNPWTGKDFNSYSIPFEPGKGILSVKREFAPEPGKAVDRILLRATALGIFDLFVNGNRVTGASDGVDVADELKPGWTDYRKRVFEFEYDITEYCSGQQTDLFVAEVSPGWWTGRISFGFYGYRPCAFCGEIEIVYADGQSAIFASEEDWDVTIGGPVLRADIWDGEYYDATVPEPSIHPEAHEWKKAEIFAYDGAVEPASGPRIRSDPDLYLRPVSAVLHSGTEDNGTEYGRIRVLGRKVGDGCEKCTVSPGQALILDLGQNMVGRPLLLVRAERGVKISLYFAEMLNTFGDPSRGDDGPEGSMYIKNYRSARARVVYVAAGTGETEYYFPTHSFFGFRYVEVRADGPAELVGLCGEVIRSAVPETGDFYCDDPEVNRLFSNIVWGMRGNYLTAPTDCPQRDERLGWTGDTQVFSGAASYIGNIDSFMHKWLGDARHSQEGFDGAYCDVIPRVFKGMNGNAGWTDAGIIVPYRLWEMYGDTDIINEHYDSMEKYMEYLTRYGYDGPNTAYGDWLSYEPTDKRYIAVCYYYHDAKLMEEMSRIAGRADRAGHYAGLAAKILEYWTQKYRRGDLVSEDTQTGCLLPLAFDMADGAFRDSLVARLRQKIVGNGYTLSTGFIGTGLLCDTLSKVGEDGLAYSLLLQTRDPSWLYSVRQGATTVWERWNSYTKERGFGDVGMNSFNHYAYGCVAAWMFSGICGIRPDRSAPGFSHFILSPTPDLRTDAELPEGQKRIDLARATYEAVSCQAGDRIESGWERVNGDIVYSFVIPEGLSATASLPAGKTFRINGLDCSLSDLGGRVDGGRAELELGPGAYEIVISY